jgi:RecA-family ATPase
MTDETWEQLEAAREAAAFYDERAVTAAWLDGQDFPPLEWTVRDILPEGLGLLAAPPKAGKSWMTANFALACASGGSALGVIPVKQRPVLLLALEDGHRRLQARFRTLMEGQPLPEALEVVTRASSTEAMLIVDEFLRRHRQDAPLVVIDTLGKVKPPKASNEDAYAADYRIGGALKKRIDDVRGGCLLLVHHTRKAGVDDFIDAVSGTAGIAGSADFVLVLNRRRHASEAVLCVTGRDVPESEYALTTNEGRWALDGMDLMDAAATARRRRESGDLGDRSADALTFVNSRAQTRPADLAAHLGIDKNNAGTYLRRLADAERIAKPRRGLYGPLSEVSEVSETDEPA